MPIARQSSHNTVCAVAWTSHSVIAWMRQRLAAAGGDPALIPDEPFAFWRLDEVERRVGVKKSTIYRWMKALQFPQSVNLGAPPHTPGTIRTAS